ncbi:MAG: alpha/beta hydrolase [Clostridia bacterium]|nr:alpha/beta hydrolase [Clostridia bacterium]
MSKIYTINNRKMYVYTGNPNGIPILYIHGAPGIGVIEYESFLCGRFFEDYYLIAPEQRGVWRSQELDSEEDFDLDLIIEDLEELRKVLNIDKWILLTHCLGARTAVKYYCKYPDNINFIIFENPVFDSVSPFKEIIKIQLALLKRNVPDKFEEYSNKLNEINNPYELENYCSSLEKLTGIESNNITMSVETIKKLSKLKEKFSIELFMRSRLTEIKMSHCIELYMPINNLIKEIKVPVMIIHGAKDITVPESVISLLKENICECEVYTYDNCKHWVHLDDEDGYFRCVNDYCMKMNKKRCNKK